MGPTILSYFFTQFPQNFANPDRKRPICPNLEEEAHFLLHCRTLSVLRDSLVDTVMQTLDEKIN